MHPEALSRIPRARLVVVHNHVPEKARALGERWCVLWTTGCDNLLARPDVDVVSIGTPSGTCAGLAEAGARVGKRPVIARFAHVGLAKRKLPVSHRVF